MPDLFRRCFSSQRAGGDTDTLSHNPGRSRLGFKDVLPSPPAVFGPHMMVHSASPSLEQRRRPRCHLSLGLQIIRLVFSGIKRMPLCPRCFPEWGCTTKCCAFDWKELIFGSHCFTPGLHPAEQTERTLSFCLSWGNVFFLFFIWCVMSFLCLAFKSHFPTSEKPVVFLWCLSVKRMVDWFKMLKGKWWNNATETRGIRGMSNRCVGNNTGRNKHNEYIYSTLNMVQNDVA